VGESSDDRTAVTTLKELSRRGKLLVTMGTEPVALFLANGRVYALHDTCIHKERSLSNGTLLRGHVICPGHQWAFDLETGWVEDQEQCQPTYDVQVDDGVVYVNPHRRVLTEHPTRAGSK
jgi:nitrite reductase (NADH) small subunit